MEQFKRAKCILLDTQNDDFQFQLSGFNILSKDNGGKRKHLYIISDDEIKKGDWFYNGESILQSSRITDIIIDTDGQWSNIKNAKKIIATTNTSLKINTIWIGYKGFNSLPQPSQQFIEKYVEEYNKGNIITNVLVEWENNYDLKYYTLPGCPESCKRIDNWKLKINSKDNTIAIKKTKDNWNRKEVIADIKRMINLYTTTYINGNINKWIEENL